MSLSDMFCRCTVIASRGGHFVESSSMRRAARVGVGVLSV